MVADSVFHFSKPVPVNLATFLNVVFSETTLETSHPPRFALNSLAPLNAPSIVVTEDVIHLLKRSPVMTVLAAAVLLVIPINAPAWFLFMENM